MMGVTGDYIGRSLSGVMRMSLHDARGLQFLEMTADGFFRSFAAIALSLPLYVYAVYGQMNAFAAMPDLTGRTVSFSVFLTLHALFFVGNCFFALIAMTLIARRMKLEDAYVPFTIVYNWGTLAIHLAGIVPIVLYGIGLVGPADAIRLPLVVMGLALYLRFATFAVVFRQDWQLALALALGNGVTIWAWWILLTSLV
jgi:hypothetical protein